MRHLRLRYYYSRKNISILLFGHTFVCIDGMHGLNVYDFYLSVVKISEFGNRVPIALTSEKFFSVINNRVDSIHTKIFMSNFVESFYNNRWFLLWGLINLTSLLLVLRCQKLD